MIKVAIKLLNLVAGFMAFGGLTKVAAGGTGIALLAGVIGAFLNFYSVSRLLELEPSSS